MKAVEDFMEVVLSAHVIGAANTVLCEKPDLSVQELSHEIIQKFVTFLGGDSIQGNGVYKYAKEVLSLGLLWECFHDAIKEGDGKRVLMIWKYLLLVLIAAKHKIYAKEAMILQLQHQYLFSDCHAAQLMWSRFVNTRGQIGCNVHTDLHMEHLNRRFKNVFRNLGANVNPKAIIRASKTIGIVDSICSIFEEQFGQKVSGRHVIPSFKKDQDIVIKTLEGANVFKIEKNKHHKTFQFKKGLISVFDKGKTTDWIFEKVLKVIVQLYINNDYCNYASFNSLYSYHTHI